MAEPVPERTPQIVTVNADDLRTVLNQDYRHAHQDHGIWDEGHGEKSGTACRECAARDGLIAALDLAHPTTPQDDTTEPMTTEDRYWQREAQKARAERDALALGVLHLADAWVKEFGETGIRAEVCAATIRRAVETMGWGR